MATATSADRRCPTVTVLWCRRAASDHPHAELAATFGPAIDVRFVEWDAGPGRRRARHIVIKRIAGREPIAVHLPRWDAVRELVTSTADVVITRDVGLFTALAGLGAIVRRGRRRICLLENHYRHTGPASNTFIKRRLRRLCAFGVDRFVVCRREGADWLRSDLGVRHERVVEHWWVAGFDRDDVGAVAAAESGVGADRETADPTGDHTSGASSVSVVDDQRPGIARPLRMAIVGSLSERKRVDLAITVVSELRRRGVAARLAVVGDGSLHRQLAEQATRDGVDSEVEFVGRLPHARLPALLGDIDLVVVPSNEDNLPRTGIEALSCGVPVAVSQAVGYAGDLVVDGDNGLVISSWDAGVWAERIASITPQEWEVLRDGARRTAVSLTPECCAAPLEAQVLALAGGER